MRNLSILTTLFLFLTVSTQAQLISMTPNQALPGQTLQTTITSNGNFLQLNTPSGNLFQIRLLQGVNVINIFDLWGIGYWTTTVDDPYTVTAEVIIPASPSLGLYDLEVITGDTLDPWSNQVTYTLPNAFTVGIPDGYITGTLYEDLNQDGIKDTGEPGLPGRVVNVMPSNINLTTDSNGDYSFSAMNGNYTVSYVNNINDYLFLTSANGIPVTISNSNAPGTNFGLQHALTAVSPDTSQAGVFSTHQIVSDLPIFIPGGSQNGNVVSLSVLSSPGVYVTVATAVTVIDSFTVEVELQPDPANIEDSIDIVIGVTGPYSGSHYLRKKFTIVQSDGVVAGTVYHDLNENGIQDTGEPGLSPRTVKIIETNNTDITNLFDGGYVICAANGNYTVTVLEYPSEYMFITSGDTLSVTINNAMSVGNDFGLNEALVSITPAVGYQGTITSHQITSSRPIFFPGGGPNGNVSSVLISTFPSSVVVNPTAITVIDSFNIQFYANVPIGTQIGSNIDLRVGLNAGYIGSHYLRQQFSIAAPAATVSGRMFFDQNQNKIDDPGEPGINYAGVQLLPDATIAFANMSGNYILGSTGGVQTLTPLYNIPGLSLFTDSASYTFAATGSITGKDFGFISTLPDYSIDVHSLSIFPRCNSQQNAYFRIRNLSNTAYNAIAWLKYSPSMTYISSTIPSSVSNDTIYWNINNIPPYSEIIVDALFQLPAAGFNIYLWAGATSLDTNNAQQLMDFTSTYYLVACSWDPNDKQVTPPGIFAQHFTLMGDTLEYLIRFQNTGNDTAFNVVVLDTLDNDLDFSTFEILNSSHSMQTELQNNGALQFAFDNIMLVDSNMNEAESHGYIQYRIRANTGLPDSTIVNNTAYIYFDFNPPVLTNTTLNTMVYVLPVGIAETNSSMGITVYPNPFSNSTTMLFENPNSDNHKLIIHDLSGKSVVPEMNTRGNKLVIEKNKLAGGVYFYSLINTSTNHISNGKLLIE